MPKKFKAFVLVVLVSVISAQSQDNQELQAERQASAKLKGEHPLIAISRSKPAALRSELVGIHPRVFLTQAEIENLKKKTQTQKELWQTVLSRVRALTVEPP